MRDFISLKATKVPTFLGLAAVEREQFQWIDLDLKMGFDSKKAADTGKLVDCIDYVRILGELKFILWFSRFYLIETALETIAQYILQTSVASDVVVSASKPEALGLHALPSLTVTRDLRDYPKIPENGCYIENTDVKIMRKQASQLDFEALQQAFSAALCINHQAGSSKKGQVFLPQEVRASDLSELLFLQCLDKESKTAIFDQYPRVDGSKVPVKNMSFYEEVLDTYVARND